MSSEIEELREQIAALNRKLDGKEEPQPEKYDEEAKNAKR